MNAVLLGGYIQYGLLTILLTKTTAMQTEVALRYHKVCGLYFIADIFVATTVILPLVKKVRKMVIKRVETERKMKRKKKKRGRNRDRERSRQRERERKRKRERERERER